MKTIYVVALEPLETRYTCQWYEGLPKALLQHVAARGHESDVQVVNIVGNPVQQQVTKGAFINFAGTNIWKSEQLIEISKLIGDGKINDGDHFLFTDAWNPAIIQVRYMLDLLKIKAKMSGIWHAGSYDPQDFLGRLVEDKRWSLNAERSMFYSLDYNTFATEFHSDLFVQNVLEKQDGYLADIGDKIVHSGQPHETLINILEDFPVRNKRDLILFPHRIAPEKQPEIFRDLVTSMPEFEFVVCQDSKLTKQQYHELLHESKIVFSANLQETLGIGQVEGLFSNAIPLCPDRLSYKEMFKGTNFLYQSEWTESWESYLIHKDKLIDLIRMTMRNYNALLPEIQETKEVMKEKYFRATVMYDLLLKN